MPAVGLLILAAGASSRMEGALPKQLLPYRGRSLLRHAAETALASHCHPIAIVFGAQARRMRQEVVDLPVTAVTAPRWELGMGASLHAGLDVLDAGGPAGDSLDGIVISLCDQPLVSAAHLDALVEAATAHPDTLVASEYGGTLGVPALFPKSLFPELRALPETQGAKPILLRHAAQAVRIPFPDGLRDLDTQEDYQRLLSEADRE